MTYRSATIRFYACDAVFWIEWEGLGHSTIWDASLNDDQRSDCNEFNPQIELYLGMAEFLL